MTRPIESWIVAEAHSRKWPSLERNTYLIAMGVIGLSTVAAILCTF